MPLGLEIIVSCEKRIAKVCRWLLVSLLAIEIRRGEKSPLLYLTNCCGMSAAGSLQIFYARLVLYQL